MRRRPFPPIIEPFLESALVNVTESIEFLYRTVVFLFANVMWRKLDSADHSAGDID